MILDLQFEKNEYYHLFKFPDNSVKFILTELGEKTTGFRVSLTNNDFLIALLMVSDVLKKKKISCSLYISYMMYQQDDRHFDVNESFGLKVISDMLNSTCFENIIVFHPHSDKVEFINNIEIQDNSKFIDWAITHINKGMLNNANERIWVIPDSGAFKTQFKQIQKMNYPHFISCNKSRNHKDGEITIEISSEDLKGRDCFIIDDICLGGKTFLGIAEELKKRNCGKLYLIVSHGIFNNGVENLLEHFEGIYTTNSITKIQENEKVRIYKL